MSVFKTKINIFKKTTALVLAVFLLFFLIAPAISFATSYWFFIEESEPWVGGDSSKEKCNTRRTLTLQNLVAVGNGDELVTECFEYPGAKIDKDEYEEFYKEHPPQTATAALEAMNVSNWWFIYKYTKDVGVRKTGDHVVSNPYINKEKCEEASGSLNKNETEIVKSCYESTTRPATPENTIKQVNTDTTYTPLAPLPWLGTPGCVGTDGKPCIDTQKSDSNPCPFGNYLNIMIKIFLGVCAVLAMVMIVIGGIEYMTSDLASSKEAGKKTITSAILGLLLALGAYLILNTINPQLLSVCLDNLPVVEIIITEDEKLFAKTESSVKNVGEGYELKGTFESPSPSPGVLDFKNKLDQGYSVSQIIVSTTGKVATFVATKGTENTALNVPIKIGQSGVSSPGEAKEGDAKTPIGTTYVTSDRRPSPTPPIKGKAALTRDGNYNMGAAFVNFGATVNEKDRGMGFHGRFESGLGGSTNGCIRMSNDDLVVLSPYIGSGLKVIIQ